MFAVDGREGKTLTRHPALPGRGNELSGGGVFGVEPVANGGVRVGEVVGEGFAYGGGGEVGGEVGDGDEAEVFHGVVSCTGEGAGETAHGVCEGEEDALGEGTAGFGYVGEVEHFDVKAGFFFELADEGP